MIRALMKVGAAYDAIPYGTEALGVMRIEKGHAAGNELNGQTTAAMLGLGGMVSKKKDSIGSNLAGRMDQNSENDLRLVGFRPVNQSAELKAGAHFVLPGDPADTDHDKGWMTSVAFSPELGHSIGMGFLRDGQNLIGKTIRAFSPVQDSDILVEVCSPHHVDPEGGRQRA